jgi:hypothetical protein
MEGNDRKEMGTSKQFKVIDVDFGRELTNRKELLAAATEKITMKN